MNNKSSLGVGFLFQLDARLQSTCFFLGHWTLSSVLLKNDQSYPWFVLVPRKSNIEEIYQLSQEEQFILMQEINQLSLLIKNFYQPKKINVASLGNVVQQLHIHCVARTEHDPLWPQGIWQTAYKAVPYTQATIEEIVPKLKQLIEELAPQVGAS